MDNYSFASFSYGGVATSGFGINDSGIVVGAFGTDAAAEGFTYDHGQFTLVNYPQSGASTQVSGISASGELIGFNSNTSSAQAFTEANGVFTTIQSPTSSSYVNGFGINRTGTELVGAYIQGQNIISFAKTGNRTTILTYPGYGTAITASNQTLATGVNSAGEIVGSYGVTGGTFRGFTYVNGTFASVNFAGATSTSVYGVNDAGELVGSYTTASGVQHGFTDRNGVFTTVDAPGATSTIINGVNSGGELVGTAKYSDGSQKAFTASPVLCFTTGTRIRLARGYAEIEVAVEDLKVGDTALTATGEIRPIRWIGQRTMRPDACSIPSEAWPVRILAGAFGGGLPTRDLHLSPGHPVLVGADEDGSSGILVPIMCLINGTTITRMPVEDVTYWHIELDAHDILLAEGLPAESFLDLGSRDFFEGGSNDLLHDPDQTFTGSHGRCRAVATVGPCVEAERRRLDRVFAVHLSSQCAWPSAVSLW